MALGVGDGSSFNSGQGPAGVACIDRAVQILRMYLDGRQSIAVTEVAERLGIAKSSAHRLLRSLCSTGVLQQSSLTRRYELSLFVYNLGNMAVIHSDLFQRALLPLENLYRTTGEGCHISVLDLPDVVFFERRDSARTVHVIARMANRAPANCASTGKVLLAFAPEQTISRALAGKLTRLTRHSVTDSSLLRQELAVIRDRGYSVSHDQLEIGMSSIAAPIRDSQGAVVAALGVAGPTQRLERLTITWLTEAVISCSAEISSNLAKLRRIRAPMAATLDSRGPGQRLASLRPELQQMPRDL